MCRTLQVAFLTFTIVSCTIVKSPPKCTTAIFDHPLVLYCATDLATPVAWRYKLPENNYAKYLFLFGKLKSYASTLGVSRIDEAKPGHYNLVFDKVKVESACEYQCQDNDGMAHGPVVELVALRAPISCTALEVQDDNNVTVALNLTCTLQYQQRSDKDSFIWYNREGKLETVNTLSVDDQWNTVVSTYMANPAQSSDYTFVANFRNKSGEGGCVTRWSHKVYGTPGALRLDYEDASSAVSLKLMITFIGVSVVACIIVIICIVLIARFVRSRQLRIKEESKIHPYACGDGSIDSVTGDYDYCTIRSSNSSDQIESQYLTMQEDNKSETTIKVKYPCLIPESVYSTAGLYEKANRLNMDNNLCNYGPKEVAITKAWPYINTFNKENYDF